MSILRRILRVVLHANARRSLLHRVAGSRLLTAAYYYVKGSFYYEQRSVLTGVLLHHEASAASSDGSAVYRLRRNIHRLEKGLALQDRERVFGLSYIRETVDLLARILEKAGADNAGTACDETVGWAFDVLEQYFQTVTSPETSQAAGRFRQLRDGARPAPGDRLPHVIEPRDVASLSYDQLKGLALQRRSVRAYRQQPVPRELLDHAIEIAIMSPSACNRQAFEFRVYDDPALLRQIACLPRGIETFRDNIPCLVVLVGKYRAYASDTDRHLIYMDTGLAAMAFLFALETTGLASCCIGWPGPGARELSMTRLLNLEDDEQVTMLIAVGYPDPSAVIPFSQKCALGNIRSYNRQ